MKKETISRICGTIAFIAFFLMLGIVGGIETDAIPLLKGAILAAASMAVWAGALYLGGFLR